jgi:predicted transcriptional regulator
VASSVQGSVLGFMGKSPELNETTISRLLQVFDSKKLHKNNKAPKRFSWSAITLQFLDDNYFI